MREIINEMVKDVINMTKKNINKLKVKKTQHIYISQYPIVSFSNKMKEFDKEIKQFLKKICITIKMLKIILSREKNNKKFICLYNEKSREIFKC